MSFRDEFALLLRARYPLIYVPTYEEERVEAAIRDEAQSQGNRAVCIPGTLLMAIRVISMMLGLAVVIQFKHWS